MRDIVLPESFGGLYSQHAECKLSQTEPNRREQVWAKRIRSLLSLINMYIGS